MVGPFNMSVLVIFLRINMQERIIIRVFLNERCSDAIRNVEGMDSFKGANYEKNEAGKVE